MKLLSKSITNSVVYSGISLTYSFLLIFAGKYRDINLQNIALFNVGVIILIMSVILGILITSTVQRYDEY
jgi:ABC-type phosphate transport system permease subunit